MRYKTKTMLSLSHHIVLQEGNMMSAALVLRRGVAFSVVSSLRGLGTRIECTWQKVIPHHTSPITGIHEGSANWKADTRTVFYTMFCV